MKIIASTKYRNFLVEIHEDEIAKISGSNYAVSMDTRPEVGREIKVSEAWEDLQRFRSAREKIKTASETLRGVASIAEAASVCYIVNPEPEV